MKQILSLALITAMWVVVWPVQRAEAALTSEALRGYIQRVGARI